MFKNNAFIYVFHIFSKNVYTSKNQAKVFFSHAQKLYISNLMSSYEKQKKNSFQVAFFPCHKYFKTIKVLTLTLPIKPRNFAFQLIINSHKTQTFT